MTIIEQAREQAQRLRDDMDYPCTKEQGDEIADTIAALCRALIARDDALQGLVTCDDEAPAEYARWADAWADAWIAARRALADEPHTGQGD